jgi:hypothetical protein
MLMLIDTRSPAPRPLDDERRPVELNWRIWSWLGLAVMLFALALLQDALVGSLLLIGAFVSAMKALGAALDRCDGLREHKQ